MRCISTNKNILFKKKVNKVLLCNTYMIHETISMIPLTQICVFLSILGVEMIHFGAFTGIGMSPT